MADEEDAGESLADSIKASMKELDGASEDQAETPAGDDEPDDGEAIEADAAGGDSEADGDGKEEVDGGAEVETLAAPEHWANEDKEAFASLPVEAQELVLQRNTRLESLYNERASGLTALEKYKPLESVFEPLRAQFAMQGMDEVQAVRMLLGAHQALQTNPAQTIQYLASQYGVDLSAHTPQADSEADEFVDPTVKALGQQVTAVQSRLDQLLNQQQTRQAQALEQQIAQFRDATDESGGRLHPHFDTLRPHMAGLMQSGAAKTMDDAYKMALWASPELRQELLAEQTKEAEEKARKERRERAEKARKSASKPKSSSSPEKSAKPDKPKSLNQDLREVAEELGLYG